MQIALLSDTHFGCRNDSQQFLDHFLDFIEFQFIPECEKRGVTTILHLGDLMDRRKFVNFQTLNQVRERFIEKLEEKGITMYCLVGNHDTYYKNTNNINSLTELFGERYECFQVIEKPTTLVLDGIVFDLIPWINKENRAECEEHLYRSEADIVCGHFELQGYEVFRGVKFEGGMTDNLLQKFDKVWTGHFHMRHKKNNVRYLGTPYQITFSDLHEKKGFYFYDTQTEQLESVENPERIFLHIDYWDGYHEKDLSTFENKYVKLFVQEKTNQIKFDKFVDALYDAKVGSLTIVEVETTTDTEAEEELADMSLDTMSMIIKEAEDIYAGIEEVNIYRLKTLIQEIYMESISQ